MPTTFPAADDVFDVPSAPVSTPLGATGDSSRTHGANHRDLGDALDAMQVEQTLLAHSHDGLTPRHGSKLLQVNTHQSPDTDSGPTSIHHTIGSGANQYASGTHTHVVVATYPVGAFFFSVVATNPASLGVAGTWTAVGQRFLCASGGGLGLTAGDQGGSNSHSHSIDASTNTLSAHDHNLASSTSTGSGSHAHTGGAIASNGASHTHVLSSTSLSTDIIITGGLNWVDNPHSHTSSSNSASHGHTAASLDTSDGHTHEIVGTGTSSSGSHSHTNAIPSTTNNLVPLFVVYIWKRVS